MRIEYASISEVAAMLRNRTTTAVKLTKHMLDRIAETHKELSAYITVTSDLALEQAQQADLELSEGLDRGPLHGIPVAVKDLIDTQGVLTTGGSKHYENRVPDKDAIVISRLKEAGAVLLGKTGLHELAFGSTSINHFLGAISNPWNLK